MMPVSHDRTRDAFYVCTLAGCSDAGRWSFNESRPGLGYVSAQSLRQPDSFQVQLDDVGHHRRRHRKGRSRTS